MANAEQLTSMNFASDFVKLDSSKSACLIPFASLVYPYSDVKADFSAGWRLLEVSRDFSACPSVAFESLVSIFTSVSIADIDSFMEFR